jgi:hypothetical protein
VVRGVSADDGDVRTGKGYRAQGCVPAQHNGGSHDNIEAGLKRYQSKHVSHLARLWLNRCGQSGPNGFRQLRLVCRQREFPGKNLSLTPAL